MELVIKIPESEIPKQQDIIEIPLHFIDGKVCEAGGYGFDVLPKGHGRLIDADELKKHKYHDNKRFENVVAVAQIDWADTIIEADKENTK